MRDKVKRYAFPLLAGAFVLGIILSVIFVPVTAESDIIEVNNFQDLYYVVAQSRTSDFLNRKILLTDNINITENDLSVLEANGFKSLTIGSEAIPFRGEFDGAGYTINGLSCNLSEANAQSDTGLFAYTENAIIRNLVIDNADIRVDYRGGIIAGSATNTLFENITVKNSYMRVSCYNNALTLVTDAGLTGGGLIGEASGCVLYNCESNNTRVNNNNTAGVQALGGKGLYLGGLIGSATDGTLVEYSRAVGGEVKSSYDVAVGALGGNTLYVGGLIGEMRKGSKVIDSFATNSLNYYCATYVSVGSGNSGHIGGISAAVYGKSCELTRCHYAGEMTSKQYNAVLVIPIIQKNINLSGICNKFEGGTVSDCYYKESVTGSVKTLGNKNTTSEYGPQSDERYVSPTFWTGHDFDFVGNKSRASEYNDNHFNKWVMDYNNNIPVHGLSLSATLDFPGAGEVIISESELVNKSVSTTDPYNFAVQAVNFNEKTIDLKAIVNEGYRFVGWYRIPDMLATSLPEEHSFFADIFKAENLNSTELEYNAEFEDNDLFAGYYQAKVLFHDISNNVVALDGSANADTSDDWYDYETRLPEVNPQNAPDSDTATLIGWTTDKGGYSAITSDKLIEVKNRGAFYETNVPITKALSLYPVYADLISNVTVVFEGHEQDDVNNSTLRDGVGSVSAFLDEDGVGVVSVVGIGENNAFPDGYRFIGWYDENNVCVSKEAKYILEEVDLTVPHTYTARFEYRVDYYSNTKEAIADFDSTVFAQMWHKYNEDFKNLENVLLDGQDSFVGWYYGGQSDDCSCDNAVESDKTVVGPFAVHAHIDGSSSYDIIVKTDFPGACVLTNGGSPASGGSFWVKTEANEGYNFLFWGAEGSNRTSDAGDPKSDWTETSFNSEYKPSGSAYSTLRWYGFEAHLSADVMFHFKDTNLEPLAVTRHYLENVFLTSDVTHEYQYPLFGSTVSGVTDVSMASPNEMNQDGYYFAGWIDKNNLTAEEWDYIYGTTGGTYAVNNDKPYECNSLSVALANVLDEDAVVAEPMDLYPVYVKVNIVTDTNIASDSVPGGVNVPSKPTYSYELNENGEGSVTVTADISTPVEDGSDELYWVTHITVQRDNGDIIKLTPNENGQVSYDIKAGPTYTFIAYYQPLVIVYHTNEGETQVYTRQSGELLGDSPLPSFDLSTVVDVVNGNQNIFVGWTETKPSTNEFHTLSYKDMEKEGIKLVSETRLVLDSLELYPVYASVTVSVNSNIDEYLSSKDIDVSGVRYTERPAVDELSLVAVSNPYERYEFIGWYVNYTNLDNLGTLVSSSESFSLEGEEPFSSVTYTAVYRDSYEVNYYGIDGTVIYSVNIFEGDGRSFTETVEETTVPVDHEAFSTLQELLPVNAELLSWRWDNNGVCVEWDDFCDVQIEENMKANDTRVMNLYPVVRSLSAFDASGSELVPGIDETADILLNKDSGGYAARLSADYAQPKLTVHIEDAYYSTDKAEIVNVTKTPVRLFADAAMTTFMSTENTNNNGDAIFALFGTLKIKKLGVSEGDFIFSLASKDEPSVSVASFVVSAEETVSVVLPLGSYLVTEDSSWAWRYAPLTQEVVLSTRSSNEIIELTNTYNTRKWFDSSARNKNEFSVGGESQ